MTGSQNKKKIVFLMLFSFLITSYSFSIIISNVKFHLHNKDDENSNLYGIFLPKNSALNSTKINLTKSTPIGNPFSSVDVYAKLTYLNGTPLAFLRIDFELHRSSDDTLLDDFFDFTDAQGIAEYALQLLLPGNYYVNATFNGYPGADISTNSTDVIIGRTDAEVSVSGSNGVIFNRGDFVIVDVHANEGHTASYIIPVDLYIVDLNYSNTETFFGSGSINYGDGTFQYNIPNNNETYAGIYRIIYRVRESGSLFYGETYFDYELKVPTIASISANSTYITNGTYIQFLDQSQANGTISYQWNFGDGTVNSTSQNPIHRYTQLGIFNVTLTIEDQLGNKSIDMIQITVYILPGDFVLSADILNPGFNSRYNLTWDESNHADNYSVYRSDVYITEINGSVVEIIHDCEETSYYFDYPINGTHFYLVIARNEYGNTSSNCYSILTEINLPETFQLSSNAGIPDPDGIHTLSWTDSNFAEYYNIYCYETPITEINSSIILVKSNVEDVFFVDNRTDGIYYYVIVAINEFGNYTSNCIKVTILIGYSASVPGFPPLILIILVGSVVLVEIRKLKQSRWNLVEE